jgi:hypothetical protein
MVPAWPGSALSCLSSSSTGDFSLEQVMSLQLRFQAADAQFERKESDAAAGEHDVDDP